MNPSSNKVALVTGASGFIGKHILGGLVTRGFEVHAVSRRAAPSDAAVHWHRCDLADHALVARLVDDVQPTHLLHLAWGTTHGYYTSPENVGHLRDALHLLDRVVRAGGRRIVGAGTSAEYGIAGDDDLSAERTPLRPNGLYGVCKKALFEVGSAYASTTGIEHAWGRVFFAYGPGEDASRPLPALLRRLERGERVPFQRGDGLRDYVYVADVAEAFVRLLDSSLLGALNVGTGEAVSLREFVSQLAEAAGRPGLVDFGAVGTPAYEPRRVVADPRRLRDELGWRPSRQLRPGLEETVRWWRGVWSAEASA